MAGKHRLLGCATALALAFGLSACNNNDDLNRLVSPSPTPTPTPAPAPTPTPTPTPTSYDVTRCISQIVPGTNGRKVVDLVVPDVLTLDFALPSTFPNGRALPDQVIDITLAVLFLDLTRVGAGTLANVPVNPPNDTVFRTTFPYLAAPNGNPPLGSIGGTNFNFRTDAESAYTRVDRMGMPAVATALIASSRKIAYNDADPVADQRADFTVDIANQLTTLTNALADDFTRLNLPICATPK